MLKSAYRRLWDLRVLVWDACETSRRRDCVNREPTMSMAQPLPDQIYV